MKGISRILLVIVSVLFVGCCSLPESPKSFVSSNGKAALFKVYGDEAEFEDDAFTSCLYKGAVVSCDSGNRYFTVIYKECNDSSSSDGLFHPFKKRKVCEYHSVSGEYNLRYSSRIGRRSYTSHRCMIKIVSYNNEAEKEAIFNELDISDDENYKVYDCCIVLDNRELNIGKPSLKTSKKKHSLIINVIISTIVATPIAIGTMLAF